MKKKNVNVENELSGLVPSVNPLFVKFGHFEDLKSVVSKEVFYPAFITGLSGNGKTFSVEQVCAELGRELFRVNITIETDEDDLLGGFRLQNGETVWSDGPVVQALERGAVLLLDEVDLGSNKLLCLQPVLEGKGIYLKKIKRFVSPAPGFTIIATGNTKGQGSETGKFIGTNILNEAFLERFAVSFEQEYPPHAVEKEILTKVLDSYNMQEELLVDSLLKWAGQIRSTYDTGAIDDVISTRRLVHIIHAYAIFKDKYKAIDRCISRFNHTTKETFMSVFKACDVSEEEMEKQKQREKEREELEAKKKNSELSPDEVFQIDITPEELLKALNNL